MPVPRSTGIARQAAVAARSRQAGAGRCGRAAGDAGALQNRPVVVVGRGAGGPACAVRGA
jgi:hypothetical protein